MQVEYEIQLIESSLIKASNFTPKENQPLDVYTLFQPSFGAIEYICSCLTSNVVALYHKSANQIVIIDTKTHLKLEKFPLKPCNKKFSKNSFSPKAIDFSPDGTRLAIGQSDCIIYIYKLASQLTNSYNDTATSTKTTLTGKFVCSSPVTCISWTDIGIIFGTQDGKIKLVQISSKGTEGQASSTKVISVYSSTESSMPLSIATRAQMIAIGFVDCTIALIAINLELLNAESSLTSTGNTLDIAVPRRNSSITSVNYIKLSYPPYNVILIQQNTICCAGSDGKISFYSMISQTGDSQGVAQTSKLDFSLTNNKQHGSNLNQTIDLKEELVALDYSNSTEILTAATTNSLLFIKYDQDQARWQLQNSSIEFANIGSITGVKWTRDGSQFVVGNSLGQLDLFKCNWNKQSISDQLDICHIARNKVRITDRARNLLATYKSQLYDIKRVNLLDGGQSVIIWTNSSLVLAHLSRPTQSEIPWSRDRSIKFCFDHPGFVFLFNVSAHQLSLVKLGDDHIMYTTKLDFVSKSLVCVRQYPTNFYQSTSECDKNSPLRSTRSVGSARSRNPSVSAQQDTALQIIFNAEGPSVSELKLFEAENERLALVLERELLVIVDLKSGLRESRLRHWSSIKWIELSHTCNYIIFRDTQNQLHFINLTKVRGPLKSELVVEECEFARWIPDSDVLLAQSSYKILLWYNMDKLNKWSLMIDARSYNITKALPILDLSLLPRAYPVITRIESNYSLVLSNGLSVQLDSLEIRFYSKVSENNLDLAHEILKREDNDANIRRLWNKLGWLAIEHYNCDVAIKVFRKTGYEKMVKYLEQCKETAEETNQRLAMLKGDWVAFEEIAEPEQIVSTYKRLGKWSAALAYLTKMQQFRHRDIVEQQYKDWLIQKGRFLEAARIYAQTGELLEGLKLLKLKEKYEDAADLLVKDESTISGLSNSTKRLQTMVTDENLLELAKGLKSQLIANEKYEKAASICDKIFGQFEIAQEFYLKSKNFDMALEMARKLAKNEQKVNEIEESAGDNLMQTFQQLQPNLLGRKRAIKAIEHFIRAGSKSKALKAAVELRQFDRGFEILNGLTEEEKLQLLTESCAMKEYCKTISDFKLKQGKLDDAINALMAANEYEQAINLYVESDRLQDAYEVALKRSDSANDREATVGYFVELARKVANSGTKKDEEKAEKIFLMLNRPELAIKLHKELTKNYNRMLELVEQLQPDQLEETLLILARELESQGDLEGAERYLLRLSDSEWTNVIRMYRIAGRWSDAFRVAKENCTSNQDPLLIQLASWWSKSLVVVPSSAAPTGADSGLGIKKKEVDYQAAYELLVRLDLFEPVLEFCCEKKDYSMALGLSSFGSSTNRRVVSRRFASLLEEQHNFEQAEAILVESGQFEEATKMYLDNDMHSEALRLVEGQLSSSLESLSEEEQKMLVELLNKSLISYADKLAGECEFQREGDLLSGNKHLLKQPTKAATDAAQLDKKLLLAQQMYLRAQHPELAVVMYKERGMWQRAIQVAQRFAPQLLESLESALDEQLAGELASAENLSRLKQVQASTSIIISDNNSSSSYFRQEVSTKSDLTRSPSDRRAIMMKREQQQQFQLEREQEPEPVEYLRSQVELLIRDGDLGAAREALGKFLDSLVEGGGKFQSEASIAQVSHKLNQLDRLLQENPDDLLEITNRADQQLIWTRVLSLSSWVFSHCSWLEEFGNSLSMSGQNRAICFQLRDLLVKCNRLLNQNQKQNQNHSSSWLDLQLERHLLLAHWLTLLGCISGELEWACRDEFTSTVTRDRQQFVPASRLERLRMNFDVETCELLDLAARLAVSLLRYTDELDGRQALYAAGQWCLIAKQVKLTRICWTRMLEICTTTKGEEKEIEDEDEDEHKASETEVQLKSFGVPARMRLVEPNPVSEQQIGDVRAWLVETLISNSSSSTAQKAEENGRYEKLNEFADNHSSSSSSSSSSSFSVISGSFIGELLEGKRRNSKGGGEEEEGEQVVIQVGSFQALASEWRTLESASRRQSRRGARSGPPKELLLHRLLEFMNNELSKAKVSSC